MRQYNRIYSTFNGHSGRPMQVRTPENVAVVLKSASDEPKKSVRRHSVKLDIGRESVRRMLKYNLKLKPYKIQVHQWLTEANAADRVTMCRWLLQEIEDDETLLGRIWFSDEAHFYLNGHVNNKNYIFWGSQKPDEVYEQNLHDLKVTAWVAMSRQGIIGPYFFMDGDGDTLTVNSDRYLKMLTRYWRALGRLVGMGVRGEQHFMQDGAAPHTARVVLQWLRDHFDERVISRGTVNPWASHSPDLNPLDFHLWGYLKDKICGSNFQTIQELRAAVTANARAIPLEQVERVIDNFVKRLRACIARNGRHMEHVL